MLIKYHYYFKLKKMFDYFSDNNPRQEMLFYPYFLR